MVVARQRLAVARRRGAPVFSFMGKFIMMQARGESLASARVASRCESDILLWRVVSLLCPQKEEKVCQGAIPNRD